eukprot:TRINITY_DN20961_c0_g1_i3.p1 TRINITY_DN20961_c0_g1~~TRINITY_DN20961_c0_g1_i3.p1  ORF type:complete len:289 (+),score=23.81 TRINITY_DN20961_c0_g1_i3:158-1024(+)
MQGGIIKDISAVVFPNLLKRGVLLREECGSMRLVCRSTRDMLDISIMDLRPRGTYVFQLQECVRIFKNVQKLDLSDFAVHGSSNGVKRLIRKMLLKLKKLHTIVFTSDFQVHQLVGTNDFHELGKHVQMTLQTCSYQGLLYLCDAAQKNPFKALNVQQLHVSFQHRQLQVLNAIFGKGWNMKDCLSVNSIIFHVFMLDQNIVGNMHNMRTLKRWFNSLQQVRFYSYGVALSEISDLAENLQIEQFEVLPFEQHFLQVSDCDKFTSSRESNGRNGADGNKKNFAMLSKA